MLRWARALTGRRRVLVFDGGYHGSVDATLVDRAPDGRTVARASLLGQAHDPAAVALALPFNTEPAVEAALAGHSGIGTTLAGSLLALAALQASLDEVMRALRVAARRRHVSGTVNRGRGAQRVVPVDGQPGLCRPGRPAPSAGRGCAPRLRRRSVTRFAEAFQVGQILQPPAGTLVGLEVLERNEGQIDAIDLHDLAALTGLAEAHAVDAGEQIDARRRVAQLDHLPGRRQVLDALGRRPRQPVGQIGRPPFRPGRGVERPLGDNMLHENSV